MWQAIHSYLEIYTYLLAPENAITSSPLKAFMATGDIADAAAKAKIGMEATKTMGSLAGNMKCVR